MRTIQQIIKDSGGARFVAESSNGSFKTDAVWKWQQNGIPDPHWPLIIRLSGATPDELYAANCAARGVIIADAQPQSQEAAE